MIGTIDYCIRLVVRLFSSIQPRLRMLDTENRL